MPLVSSNTYIEPSVGMALNSARLQQNDTFRSLLTNFKSPARPGLENITVNGANIGEQDGMLYRSATTNALYISDTVHKKSSPIGGNFTRVGIGNRIENGIVALGANATSYEIGELVATVSEDGTLASNARLYICVSNSSSAGSTASFKDVGEPLGYTVSGTGNVSFTGQSVSAIQYKATANIGIKTDTLTGDLTIGGTSPRLDFLESDGTSGYNNAVFIRNADVLSLQTRNNDTFVADDYKITYGAAGATKHAWHINGVEKMLLESPSGNTLTVTGNVRVASTGYITVPVGATADRPGTPATGMLRYNSTLNSFEGRLSAAWTSLGSASISDETASGTSVYPVMSANSSGVATQLQTSSTKLYFTPSTGTLSSTVFNSLSDIRVKSNITTIDNALAKVNSMRGVYYDMNKTRSTGVIAQEIEQVLPEVVSEGEYKTVAYGNIVGILIEAIKELSNEVRILSERVEHNGS